MHYDSSLVSLYLSNDGVIPADLEDMGKDKKNTNLIKIQRNMKTVNPIVWFEIHVDDMERAQKFYENVLDIELIELPNPTGFDENMRMLAFPSEMYGEGASGALVKMKGMKAGGNSTIVYFVSEDCSIEEARVEGAGGSIYKSKESLGEYGFMVLAFDTEGNIFGIHSQA